MSQAPEIDIRLTHHLGLEPKAPWVYQAQVPPGWEQGKGAFGGLVLGILTRAMDLNAGGEGRTLRTLSGEILAPVLPGPADITVEVLRRGKGVWSVAAQLRQDGELRAFASAGFGRERIKDRELTPLTPPKPPAFDSLPKMEGVGGLHPNFIRAFEYRTEGPFIYSGSPEPIARGWVRTREPLEKIGPAELVAYADAYYPTCATVEPTPRPTATLSFNLQVCADLETLDPRRPLYHRARATGSHGGYAHELRELWTEDGQLVALNPQTFVILG